MEVDELQPAERRVRELDELCKFNSRCKMTPSLSTIIMLSLSSKPTAGLKTVGSTKWGLTSSSPCPVAVLRYPPREALATSAIEDELETSKRLEPWGSAVAEA